GTQRCSPHPPENGVRTIDATPREAVSTTAMAISPPVPPVHALTSRAIPVKIRAQARNTGTLTETAPAACRSPTTPAPISSALRTMTVMDRPVVGASSSADGPHDAPPPPLGGAGGGGSAGGGASDIGSVRAESAGGSGGGGGDHGNSRWEEGTGGDGWRRRSRTPMTMAITAKPAPPPRRSDS